MDYEVVDEGLEVVEVVGCFWCLVVQSFDGSLMSDAVIDSIRLVMVEDEERI